MSAGCRYGWQMRHVTRALAGEPRHLQANEELGVKVLLRQANQGPDEEVSGVWAGGILLRKSVN